MKSLKRYWQLIMNESQVTVNPLLLTFVKLMSYKVLPVLNGISAVANLILVITMIALKLKSRTRIYIKFILIFQFLMSFNCSIGFQESGINTDESEIYNTLYIHVLRIYFLKALNEIFSCSISVFEQILTIEKICLFRNCKTRLTKCKVRYISGYIITFSVIILLPEFFLNQLEFKSPDIYMKKINWFGESLCYEIYINTLSLLILIGLVYYFYQTILLVIEYKNSQSKVMRWKILPPQQNSGPAPAIFSISMYIF